MADSYGLLSVSAGGTAPRTTGPPGHRDSSPSHSLIGGRGECPVAIHWLSRVTYVRFCLRWSSREATSLRTLSVTPRAVAGVCCVLCKSFGARTASPQVSVGSLGFAVVVAGTRFTGLVLTACLVSCTRNAFGIHSWRLCWTHRSTCPSSTLGRLYIVTLSYR